MVKSDILIHACMHAHTHTILRKTKHPAGKGLPGMFAWDQPCGYPETATTEDQGGQGTPPSCSTVLGVAKSHLFFKHTADMNYGAMRVYTHFLRKTCEASQCII